MIFTDTTDSDVLGLLHHKGKKYRFMKSDGAEPDVLEWRNLSGGKMGWRKMSGVQQSIAIAEIRSVWYSAGGTNSKEAAK